MAKFLLNKIQFTFFMEEYQVLGSLAMVVEQD